MKALFVDGPEKAGKSTLISAITEHYVKQGYAVYRQHFNRPQLNHWQHKRVLMNQMESAALEEHTSGRKALIIWDRAQASEVIYSRLLGRGGELAENPLVGEFGYGRVQQAMGQRLILLGPSVEALVAARNKSDHPVNPADEREAFKDYGLRYGWTVLQNEHSPEYLEILKNSLIQRLDAMPEPDIQHYVGPADAQRVILKGHTHSEWAPFTGNSIGSRFLRMDDPALMQYGWGTPQARREILLQAQELVIPDKNKAVYNFVRYYLNFPVARIKRYSDVFKDY